MSRSFKEPCITDYSKNRRPFYKRRANKIIRRISVYESIPNGNLYRRYMDSWDICDWKFWYNPEIRLQSRFEGTTIIEPDPIYKYNRK